MKEMMLIVIVDFSDTSVKFRGCRCKRSFLYLHYCRFQSKLYHWHILSNQCWCTGAAGVALMEAGAEAAVVGAGVVDVAVVGIHRLPFNFSFFEIDLLTITFT